MRPVTERKWSAYRLGEAQSKSVTDIQRWLPAAPLPLTNKMSQRKGAGHAFQNADFQCRRESTGS
jgi:hypothetical protein